MGVIIARFIAVLLLVIPGAAATVGFLKMKDSVFNYFSGFGNDDKLIHSFAWGQFLLGFILFFAGVSFIGGWIFFRDRKRNYVAPRFRKKRTRPERQKSQ
ncbi:DUF2627 domain-containing protein [Paenibacillus sp. GCM10012307]|uniref:DUF2627 domain-containing protein n=1 Tax=Paenibacillus roseus TaxID=2798579 RepID=A0A934J961_9BACL|nr:DUF2627 domain-containing protein [Paenibacillus roseus]MBJ6364129.1 DUF2627 domain-containing protein [Paenibacillus roseus]